ncbi:retrovirus-related pol polyprotein from transposon TNT 1-94 [Tanacetum coccineum]
MLLKHKDNMMQEKIKQIDTTPIDYAALNNFYKDFKTWFVPQTELSAEQAFWSHNFVSSSEPNLSDRPTNVEVPKELPKVSMVNMSLKKLKYHLANFDVCLKLTTELPKDFVKKEIYDKLFKRFTTLEKHCHSLEVDSQLNQEIFQRDNSILNQSAPSFDQLFELNELKAQSQEKDMVIKKLKERVKSLSGNMDKDKIKHDLEEIETINIELDHRVTKLIAENEHLKQTYKQLYDSIKPEKVLVIITLKDELRKFKGKYLANNKVTHHPSDPEINTEPITPKLLNKRSAHSAYIKHTQEEAAVLRDLVDHIKANYPLDPTLESACKYTKLIQELLSKIRKTCPSINNSGEQLVALTPMNKVKRVRFTEPVTSSRNTITKKASTSNLTSNKPMLSSKGVKPSTNGSGSQPSVNTKKDRILQTQSSTQMNKVETHHRKVKSSLKNKDHVVAPKGTAHVQHSKLNANSVLKCVKPTGQTFTIVGNACPLTRITTTTKVPLRKPVVLDNETSKPAVTLVNSQKPRNSETNVPISKSKVVQIVLWYLDSGCSKHMTGDRSQLTNFVNKFLGTVKFGNDHVAKILGYGDYQIGNVTISRVYYVEGLGHNLFSVGQFCDSNLEVAFRQHTCFIRNLEGVDLLTGSRGNNLYTLSLGDMMVKFLRSKDEALDFIIKFFKMIQLRLKVLVRRIKTDNGTEFVNQTLREYYEKVGISHKTSVARYPQQNGAVERWNSTLIEAARTMLIYAKALLFLCAEAVATVCYTQNRFIIRLRHDKTPYELLHDKLPDLSFFHVFGALYYPTNDSENLGKLQPKADIGIFIGYAPTKKAFQIYNRRTRRIIEIIHVDFDELTAMASEHSSSGPALHEMTPATISSGLVPNPPPSTPFVPPSRTDWDMLFQPLFDELLNPPPSVDHPAPEVVAPIDEVAAPVPAVSTGSPSSTTVDQDAPSPSNSQTTPDTQPPVIPNDVEEDNHDIEVAHMGNDPYFGIPIPEVPSDQSSSSDSIHTNVPPDHQISEHNNKWTKDHPLENIIGELARPVSTRLQLHEQALFCYYDAFLTAVEPKTYKDALTQACWIEAMQEELNELNVLKYESCTGQDKVYGYYFEVDIQSETRRTGRLEAIRIFLAFAAHMNMVVYQMDVKIAFLNVDTPMVDKSKLDEDKEGKAIDPSHYRGMV